MTGNVFYKASRRGPGPQRSRRSRARYGAAFSMAALLLLVPMLFIGCGGVSAEKVPGPPRANAEEMPPTGPGSAPEASQAASPSVSNAEAPLTPDTLDNVEQAVARPAADAPRPQPGLLQPGLVRTGVGKMVEVAFADIHGPKPVKSEVGEIVGNAIAAIPGPEPVKSGVEEIVGNAIAAIPEPETGIITAAAERVAREVAAYIPLKSEPADYTRFFVANAINRYQTQGLDATLDYYNREQSVDGQWYVFIIDGNGMVVGHPDARRLGLDLKGWVGTDANGYNFGKDMLSASKEGRWVSYAYRNPERGGIGPGHTGALEYKHVWVVRHDGLLFASGWHVTADQYTRFVVDEAIARYQAGGLDDTLAYYNSPGSVDSQWYVFIADRSGEIAGHHDPDWLGRSVDDLLGAEGFSASGEGAWVNGEDVNPATGELEDKHFWVVEHDGLTFGSGWHHDVPGG